MQERRFFLLVLSLLVGVVQAQSPMPKKATRARTRFPNRATVGLPISPQGVVRDITSSTITIQPPMPGKEQPSLPLDPKLKVYRLKTIKLADIKEARWAIVRRMPIPPNSTETSIFSITIYSNIADKPEVIGFRARIKDDAGKISVLRSDVEGMLHVEGSAVTLKTDKEVLPIQVSERTRIYEAVPAKREDIKVGANAMLEVKYLEGKPTVKMIGFMPAGN